MLYEVITDVRARELVATGASRVATACPFCYIMMDDGVKAAGKEDSEVKVADLAIHVLDAIQAGEARRITSYNVCYTKLLRISCAL